MKITNLWTETVEALKAHNMTFDDVIQVKTNDGYIRLDKFETIAKATNYDKGFGSVKIRTDLIIICKNDTWLERAEYDGKEWWEFKSVPSCEFYKEDVTDSFLY